MPLAPKEPDFLGRGWAFPVGLDQTTVHLVQGDEDIAQAVGIILGTPQGSRVMRPTFGSRLNELVFASDNAATLALAEVYSREALRAWEPRIGQIEVSAAFSGRQRNLLLITIHYVVRDTDVPANLVYPFYLQT